MKKLTAFLCRCSMLLIVPAAHAAGTYYTGNYQSPQRVRYGQGTYANTAATRNASYSSQGVSGYNRGQYARAGYVTGASGQSAQRVQTQSGQKQPVTTDSARNGLYLNAGLSKQTAMWQFEMDTAKSKLHYDNLDWLVFDLGGKYVFDAGRAKMQIDAGFQYGTQMGESSMIDDDISHGGYLYADYSTNNGDEFNGSILGHALSVGTSKSGSMLGFNAGVGLTDFWKIGNVKFTPSVGWRYLKYELETSNNFGNVILNGNFDDSCLQLGDGSTQCAPIIGMFYFDNGDLKYNYTNYVYFDANNNRLHINDAGNFVDADGNPAEPAYAGVIADGYGYADAEGSFYFQLPDVSHSYEVEWSGPYVALDMQYDINANNMFTGRVELGMPSYTSIGDQPYRVDWAHPKSVEDKAGIGSAFHFGAGASWSTAISQSVSLSIGVTYDYYTVSGADATTYLSAAHWEPVYQNAFNEWSTVLRDEYGFELTNAQIEYYMVHGINKMDGFEIIVDGNPEYMVVDPEYVAVVRSNGWKDTVDSEIESFYKSLGVRIGLNARF